MAEIERFVARLSLPSPAGADATRIDRITALEAVKGAAAAAQAHETVAFCSSQKAAQRAAGVPARLVGRGVSAQVALARRESPHRVGRLLGLAHALVNEMPATLAALTRGEINEWRATIMVAQTACLTVEDRRRIDAELGPKLSGWSDRRVHAEARRAAYRLDPRAFLDQVNTATAGRRVTLPPAPDGMSILTGHLPLSQGVAAYAALRRQADASRAEGDPRGVGQLMADSLVERVTGQAKADRVPVEIQLIVSDDSLLAGGTEPAEIPGHGPLPAPVARALAASQDPETMVWLRRLYTAPTDGALVRMESSRRLFPAGLRRFITARDGLCRTPWCGAPIRHLDHVIAHADGGRTSATNGQGLCEACNHTKQAPGWHAAPGPGGAGHSVLITTPTGHYYRSQPPDPPGPGFG